MPLSRHRSCFDILTKFPLKCHKKQFKLFGIRFVLLLIAKANKTAQQPKKKINNKYKQYKKLYNYGKNYRY